MKIALKRSLSLLLSITIIFSSAYVGLAEVDFGSINFTNPFAVKVEAASSGKCGDSAYWSLSSDGVFTVSGSGAMWDYNIMGDDCGMGDGEMAFFPSYDISKINKVIIESGITRIGDESFWVCEKLTSVTIPNTVKSIGSVAFNSCRSLKFLTIPDSVTSIANDALSGCEKLVSIDVGVNNKNYCSVAGVLFNKSKTTLMQYPAAKNNVSYTIPNSVKHIGFCAFSDCTNLTSITIPDSVTSIGESAFYNCINLTSIIIPDGVTSISFGVFYKCNNLTFISIPDSVTCIGSYAFENCTNLTSITIPDSVTTIGDYAFSGCTSLTSITIPDSVTSVGYNAFEGCTNLNAVYITDIAKWCGIEFGSQEANPLWYTKKLYLNGKLVTDLVIPDSVRSIGAYAFKGCTSLTSITIGDSVTSIGGSAFNGCTSLTSIVIPYSLKMIYRDAFSGCSKLEDVYYKGLIDDWEDIEIYDGNDYLLNAAFFHICSCNDWIIDNTASCIETGSKHGVCLMCAESVVEVIPKTAHNPVDNWVIDSYATLYEPGSKHSTCLTCGETVTEIIPQLKPETPKVRAVNTINGMNVTWNAVDGAVKYALYKRLGIESSWTYVTTTTGISYTDCYAPLAGSYYVYTVKAYNSADMASDYVKANCASVQRVVAPYTNAKNALDGINVTWNKVAGANKYIVLRRIGTESTWKTLCTTTGTSFLDKNVTPGIYYIYSIRAVNNTGYSEYDVNKRITIQRVVAPITKATNTPDGINVTWNKVSGANKYIVLRRLGTGSVWETVCTTTGASYLDKNVTSGIYYLYSIRAVNNTGYSEYDVNKRVTIKRTSFKVVSPTVVATNLLYGVQIVWNKVSGATKYNVYRSVGNSSNFVFLGTTTNTNFNDYNINNGTYYAYAVRAVNDTYISALDTSKADGIQPVTAPTTTATNHINGIQVKWYSVKGATKYNVYRRVAGSSTWVLLGTTTGTSLVDKGVTNGKYYVYSIRAINGTGYSAFDTSKTDTIQPITAPTAKVVNKSGGVQVSWNNVANATNYGVYRKTTGSNSWVLVGTTAGTSFTDTGVIRGKTYTYSIRAINGTGYSAYDGSKCASIKHS